MKLNQQQQHAVTHIETPCLVLAGAGSGKTRVIIQKIIHLMTHCGYKPSEIAAVTFTNKAAREMKARVQKMGLERRFSRGLMVSTFHTLGLTIIRQHYIKFGLKQNFSLFDDQDQFVLLKELTEAELDQDKELIKQLIFAISNWKNAMKTPQYALDHAQSDQELVFATCYHKYQQQMRAYNAVDFDDLIAFPVRLLAEDNDLQLLWQKKLRYLLIDEYQDTNDSQYQLIKLLVGNNAKFTVVGDDDQSIYSWRGAQPKNLANLQRDFPDLEVIKLEQNYRSTSRILHAANILIANNPHLFEKKLFSQIEGGDKLQIIAAKNEEHETERVVGEIITHRFLNRTAYKDYAVLYRGNHQSRLLEKSLIQNKIPYHISGGTSFFARSEIKDIMAYLRLITNPEDDNAFLRIANTPKRELGPTTLEKLGIYAHERNKPLLTCCDDFALAQQLNARQFKALQQFSHWLQGLIKRFQQGDDQFIVRDLIRDINYEDWLYENSPSLQAAEMRMKNVSELYQWISSDLAGDNIDQQKRTLQEIVQRLTLRDMMERNSDDSNADQVQLMTLHASKGLEFANVFIIGMEEGILPHQTSIDQDGVEEERRLAYVGLTRAQQRLTLSYCKERKQYGEIVRSKISRFIEELPQDDLSWQDQVQEVPVAQKAEQTASHIANIRAMLNKKIK